MPIELHPSSTQSSPARHYKMNHRQNKKLVATRSSPQLMLNQIHEEEVRFDVQNSEVGYKVVPRFW